MCKKAFCFHYFTHITWLKLSYPGVLSAMVFLNVFLQLSAAGCLPRDGDPVAADSRLEHRDTAVQPGSVPRGREVVQPRHELHPPPGDPARELRETGSVLEMEERGKE